MISRQQLPFPPANSAFNTAEQSHALETEILEIAATAIMQADPSDRLRRPHVQPCKGGQVSHMVIFWRNTGQNPMNTLWLLQLNATHELRTLLTRAAPTTNHG